MESIENIGKNYLEETKENSNFLENEKIKKNQLNNINDDKKSYLSII